MSGANTLIQRLIPKDKRFFPVFDEFGAIVKEASAKYAALLQSGDANVRKQYAAEIERLENRGDELIHKIVVELTATFITPFDREDIHRLASTLDGVLDDIYAGARRIVLYEVDKLPVQLVELGTSIAQTGIIAADCLQNLKSIHSPKDFAAKIRSIQDHKAKGDDTFLQGMASLYSGNYDSTYVLKLREIFYATDNALKNFQELSFALEAILIKTT